MSGWRRIRILPKGRTKRDVATMRQSLEGPQGAERFAAASLVWSQERNDRLARPRASLLCCCHDPFGHVADRCAYYLALVPSLGAGATAALSDPRCRRHL